MKRKSLFPMSKDGLMTRDTDNAGKRMQSRVTADRDYRGRLKRSDEFAHMRGDVKWWPKEVTLHYCWATCGSRDAWRGMGKKDKQRLRAAEAWAKAYARTVKEYFDLFGGGLDYEA